MSRFESHHLTILKRPPPSFSRRPIRFRTFSAADRAVTRVRKLIPFWARVRRLRLSRTVKGFLEIDGSLVAAVLRFVLCSQEKRALAGSEESGSFLSASLHGGQPGSRNGSVDNVDKSETRNDTNVRVLLDGEDFGIKGWADSGLTMTKECLRGRNRACMRRGRSGSYLQTALTLGTEKLSGGHRLRVLPSLTSQAASSSKIGRR